MDREKCFEERLEEVEVEGVGPIGFRLRRVVMDFEEEAVDAGGDGRSGQERNEFRLASADAGGG